MTMAGYVSKGNNPLKQTMAAGSSPRRKMSGIVGTAGGEQEWRVCALQEGCLSLDQILTGFSAPISEEHSWAIIHQSLVCLSRLLEALEDDLYLVTSTKHIWLRTDGTVDPRTFMPLSEDSDEEDNDADRSKTVDENKVIAELGMVIYNALDFGSREGEERQLSPELENIIDILTSADEQDKEELFDTEDEGIEKDEQQSEHVSSVKKGDGSVCDRSIQLCRNHLAVASEADSHFKAVCRALVSEALELSSFMEKVSRSRGIVEPDNELNELNLHDWANMWIQVMHELRNGLKLKKIDYTKTPIEFELTPYEILMDDIRSRRYKLNKVAVDGRVPPRVKKDAHDIILEFIRSRPPLKPVSERKLTECRKQSTPMDLLMESIRGETGRKSLRKTTGPPERRSIVLTSLESSRCMDETFEPSPLYNRRVIQPDKDLMDNLLNFSGDEDEEDHEDGEAGSASTTRTNSPVLGGVNKPSRRHPSPSPQNDINSDKKKDWHKALALDLVIHSRPNQKLYRRHSVSVCETPVHKKLSKRNLLFPNEREKKVINWRTRKFGVQSERRKEHPKIVLSLDSVESEPIMDSSGNSSLINGDENLGCLAEEDEGEAGADGAEVVVDPSKIRSPEPQNNRTPEPPKLHSEFIKSEQWMSALQTLELNLDEVAHIRSVLSKVELDSLPIDHQIRKDVEKKKICFQCKKTKFSLFNWGTSCSLCSQVVCSKCISKMRIPLEHFSSVPVYALTPHAASPGQHATSPLNSLSSRFNYTGSLKERMSSATSPSLMFPRRGVSVGSAPTSPNPPRRLSGQGGAGNGPTSLPVFTSQGITTVSARLEDGRRHSISKDPPASAVSRRESIQGTKLTVCNDCKEMVLQVIQSQSTQRRVQMTRSLYLQLSPGYTPEI